MADPIFTATPGAYSIVWPDQQVAMRFDRFSESHGTITAEINVRNMAPGIPPHLLFGKINLLSTRARADTVRQLNDKLNTWEWDKMMELATALTVEAYRSGEPLQILSTDDELEPPHYIIWPLLPEYQPTILFGDGGSGKSLFALLLSACLISGWADNPFGLMVPDVPAPVLYLDWETDEKTTKWSLKRLQAGLGMPPMELHYRRCYFSFAEDLPEIQRLVEQIQPRLLVIDSIGPAVAADLNANEGATRLLGRDIRKLKITTLCIGHTAKSEASGKTVFGSAFYQNLARSVWEVCKNQEQGAERMEIGLYCKKANLSQIFRPLGFDLAYEGQEAIMIRKIAVKDVFELAKRLPLHDRMENLILQRGPMTIPEMAEDLDESQDSVRKARNRHPSRFVQIGEKWGAQSLRKEEYS